MEREIKASWCHLARCANGRLFMKYNTPQSFQLDYFPVLNLKLINFFFVGESIQIKW